METWTFTLDFPCGMHVSSHTPRIIGGKEAESGEFPWQVMIRRNGHQYCGGSIISPKWILTAAHCLKDSFQRDVVAGSLFRDASASQAGTRHFILKEVVHPNFDYNRLYADIALILIGPPLEFKVANEFGSNAIGPVCLSRNHLLVGQTAIISGYGKLGSSGLLPKALMAANVTISPDSLCEGLYTNTRKYDRQTMVCAGKRDGQKDTCSGDSGGPLTITLENRVVQVGVVSFGKACGKNLPGVYTKVAAYVDWIKRVSSVEPISF